MTFVLTARSKTKQATPAQRVAKRKAMPKRSVADSPSGLAGLGGLQVNSCTNAPTIQPKLKIGEPNDKYEQEADRVAEQVMRMPESQVQRQVKSMGEEFLQTEPRGTALQRISAEEEEEMVQTKPVADIIQRKCAACEEEEKLQRQEMEEEEEETLQTKHESGGVPAVTPSLQSGINRLREGGAYLPKSTRAFMEPRFGHDFTDVKIHTNPQAADLAQKVNARAFTVGHDIFFNQGEFRPNTSSGKQLLAHELTHVVQQNSGLRPTVQCQYRDCTPAITGIANANIRLDNARQRARRFIGAAIRALRAAPAPGTTYATALNRHFITPSPAQRNAIRATYQQILRRLVISNFICNSNNICGREQAFFIREDDLIHVCRRFWPLSITCQAIILIHEAYHDFTNTYTEGAGYRGNANYPAGNTPPPLGQTTAIRMATPDAYAFFAAHIWRNTDTGGTCF